MGSVQPEEGNTWNSTNPTYKDDKTALQWVFEPSPNNKDIIGTGAHDNITFAFTNVVSLLAKGHTNMIVQFTGFPQDDNSGYNDHTFILDISKEQAPPRGIVKFFSPDATLTLSDFGDKLTAHFQWEVFEVAKVELSCEGQGKNQWLTAYR